MADLSQLENFNQIIDDINSVDRDKLFRNELGVNSGKAELTPLLDKIDEYINIARECPEGVTIDHITRILETFTQINNQFNTLINANNTDYASVKNSVVNNIKSLIEDVLRDIQPFAVAAVIKRGLLKDEGIGKQLDDALSSLNSEKEKFEKEIDGVIQGARDNANKIVSSARETATGISVEAAQSQFRDAQRPLLWQAVLWGGGLGAVIFIIFFVSIYIFMIDKPDTESGLGMLYKTGLRVTYLGVILSIAAFCLRLFRSHLHMYQHNSHRIRVTNSIAAFVQAAATNEQRDMILARLVEAVSAFGNSGLLKSDTSDMQGSKITIDNIGRQISDTTDLNK